MDWMVEILKTYGLAGVVIAALGGAVIVLWRRLIAKDQEITELNVAHAAAMTALHEQRAAEREKLVALMENTIAARRVTDEVTAKRNEIMDDMAAAMLTQANAVDRHSDRVVSQAEMFKERLVEFKHVVDSFGESNRVITGLITDIRHVLNNLVQSIGAVSVDVKAMAQLQGRPS